MECFGTDQLVHYAEDGEYNLICSALDRASASFYQATAKTLVSNYVNSHNKVFVDVTCLYNTAFISR